LGYYIDAISDVLGGTCLVLGCLFHFYKQRPFRSTPIRSSSSTSDGGSEETELMILNIEDDQSSPGIHSPSTTINEINNNLFETKKNIVLTLILFSVRYGLSAFFWDRNVHAYEDLLDSKVDTLQKQVRNYF